MLNDPLNVARLDAHRDFRHAVPTPDHFLPLLYVAGLAGVGQQATDVLVDGYTYGSLSMTAYTVGLPAAAVGSGEGAAAALPAGLPADSINI
jgi:4,5-DOPA dioxygenase extradiol